MKTPKERYEVSYWSFNKALAFCLTMSKSVGFYGRLYNELKDASEEKQQEITRLLEENKITNAIDFIMFIEGGE